MSELSDGGMSTDIDEAPRRRLFLPALLAGWAVIGYGMYTALGDAADAHPFAVVVHVVAFDLLHDAFLVPVALTVAWLLGRVLPDAVRGPVRAACAVSALFVLFSYPLVRRWGALPDNSSALPLEYGRNLVLILVAVWLTAATVIGLRLLRAHRVR